MSTYLFTLRIRWAAIGAAVAVTLGAGGLGVVNAVQSSGERGAFTAIEPCRLVDTRPGPGNVGDRTVPLGPDETYRLEGTGDNGECTGIANDAVALALNVTPVAPTELTNLRFWPDGPVPNASSLNPAPRQPPTPNAVTVDLAGDGSFRVYNFQGQVHLVADIVGFYRDHDHDDRYYTKGQSNNRYYTRGESDDRYYTKGQANNRYAPKTQTIVVPAAAFAKNTVGSDDEWSSSATSARVSAGASFMTAPIPIPVGSTITGVRYNYRDNSATIDIEFTMYLVPPDVLAATEVAGSAFASTGASGDLRTGSVDLDVVVPERNGVAVGAHAPSWASYTGPLNVRSVEVEYVLP